MGLFCGSRTLALLNQLFESRATDLQNALGRTTQRQALLTANIANVNVPGYKRQDIDFHSALQTEMGGLTNSQLAQKDQQAQAASDATSIRSDGNNVDLEREITGIADTDLRYEALTTVTSDYFAGLKGVIREGR